MASNRLVVSLSQQLALVWSLGFSEDAYHHIAVAMVLLVPDQEKDVVVWRVHFGIRPHLVQGIGTFPLPLVEPPF
jgi:hypothetical protein